MAEPSRPPRPARPANAQYKGDDLDAARGPGLGCFYVQIVLLVAFVVLTPLTAFGGWPPLVTLALMIATIVLLLLVGQTVIFLLRIVAAERGQRRPLAGRSKTVGQIEAETPAGAPAPPSTMAASVVADEDSHAAEGSPAGAGEDPREEPPGMRE